MTTTYDGEPGDIPIPFCCRHDETDKSAKIWSTQTGKGADGRMSIIVMSAASLEHVNTH
jgi:hypothetical protein